MLKVFRGDQLAVGGRRMSARKRRHVLSINVLSMHELRSKRSVPSITSSPSTSSISLFFLIAIAFLVVFSGKSSSIYFANWSLCGPVCLDGPDQLLSTAEDVHTYRDPPEAGIAPCAHAHDLALHALLLRQRQPSVHKLIQRL